MHLLFTPRLDAPDGITALTRWTSSWQSICSSTFEPGQFTSKVSAPAGSLPPTIHVTAIVCRSKRGMTHWSGQVVVLVAMIARKLVPCAIANCRGECLAKHLRRGLLRSLDC